MKDKSQRRREHLERKRRARARSHLHVVVPDELMQEFLTSEVDHSQLNMIQADQDDRYPDLDTNIQVSNEDVEVLLGEIRGKFDQQKFDTLISSCNDTVLNSIIGPFGLSNALFNDKEGGNVTTVNNAKNGIYANDSDKYNRGEYVNNSVQESMDTYKDSRSFEGFVDDEYTGGVLLHEKGVISEAHTDHIVSAKSYHADGGFMQTDEKKRAFAKDDGNYAITNSKINQSKSDESLSDWKSKEAPNRDKTNKEVHGIDDRRANAAEKRGEKTAKDHLPDNIDKAKYYGEKAVETGISEGLKMGTQQALGLLLRELVSSIFDEIKDIYNNGFKGSKLDETFFSVLKERLMKIGKRLLSKWKDVVKAFAEGAVSGFISNFITMIVNMFIKTEKQIVRIIREGFYSLLKAIKMLVSPPDGMTNIQAAHEASKLIASGIVVTGGILLEELVGKSIASLLAPIPILVPMADIITGILVGMVTGLATVLVVYMIDKIDVFGVNRDEKHKFIVQKLDDMIDQSVLEAEDAFQIFEAPMLIT